MFITKKRHGRIVADFKADLKAAHDWVEEMRKQRDAALANNRSKLTDKSRMTNMTPEESKMLAEFVRSEMATMSTPINNGGPAFPCETYGHRNGKETTIPTNGMSLRAYIAAKTMPAIIGITTPADAAKCSPDDLQAATARAACGYADALIAELGKEGK